MTRDRTPTPTVECRRVSTGKLASYALQNIWIFNGRENKISCPLLQLRGALAPAAHTQSLIKPKAVDEITMRSLLIAFVATTANALQLPMQPRTAAAAAVAIATPLPALAVHELAPGTAYGDVALNYDGMISAGVGFMLSAGKCQHHVTRISKTLSVTLQTSEPSSSSHGS